MTLTLLSFRNSVRRSVLKDVNPTTPRWSDSEISDFIAWSLDTFAHHTAQATSVSYTGVTGTTFTLPDNLFESLDESGQVYLKSGDTIKYLAPVRYANDRSVFSDDGFYTFPDKTLNLVKTPVVNGSTTDLIVRYFAYYNHPVQNTDTIDVPRWAVAALSYLVGAHSLAGVGMRSANISQWKEKPEAGGPEHNALRKQQEWFLEMYNLEIDRRHPQDRTNFWVRD